jgi:hypothetical protein
MVKKGNRVNQIEIAKFPHSREYQGISADERTESAKRRIPV